MVATGKQRCLMDAKYINKYDFITYTYWPLTYSSALYLHECASDFDCLNLNRQGFIYVDTQAALLDSSLI
jgi:hypothetical protein